MLWYIPNILTFARLVLTLIFLVMIMYAPAPGAEGRTFFLDIAFIIFVTAAITDLIDGPIARRLNVTSKFGRIIDPLADKILVCGAFICFALIGEPRLFGLSETTLAVIHWTVAAILIAREAYVTILRHVAEGRGVDFGATMSGKVKMFLQSFAIGTVIVKMAHAQTAAWGYWFTTLTFVVMLGVTVVSGIQATQRTSWRQAVV
jgi:CDP-diacylglycerol--glycerol-3-phosphate 3-phosphatidyltransferase